MVQPKEDRRILGRLIGGPFLFWGVMTVMGIVILPVGAQPLVEPNQVAQTSVTVPSSSLESTAKTVVELWEAQDFGKLSSYLSPSLQALLPIEELKRFWQAQVKDIGKVKAIGQPRLVSIANANLVFVPVEFEKMRGNVVVSFNIDNQVAGINFPTQANIQEIALRSVSAMIKGDLITARDNFDPALKTEISPQQLQEKWQNLQKLTGPYVNIVKSQVQMGTGPRDFDLVLVTIKFSKFTDDLILIFDRQKQIVGVDFPRHEQ